MEVRDVLALRSVSDPQISPDGKLVAYVVTRLDLEENVQDSDLWLVPAAGGEPRQLTFGKAADDSPQWAHDSSLLAFLSDRGEKKQVYAMRPGGGEAWPVTDWKTGVESFRLSPDGTRIAFLAKTAKSDEQEQREKDRGRPLVWSRYYSDEWSRLFVAPLEDGRAGDARAVSPEDAHVAEAVWSPDSLSLAYASWPSPALRKARQGGIHVVRAEGSEPRKLTDMPGGETPAAWTERQGVVFSASGHELGTYNARLWSVKPGEEEPSCLTCGLDENAIYVGLRGDVVLAQAYHRTGRGLYAISGQNVTRVTEGSYAQSFSASADGSLVAFLAETAREPEDVFVSSTTRFEPRRLTQANPQVEELALGEQRVVSWRSRADGEEIEGVLTLPVGYRDGERVPLLLVIHGGPSGVSSARFTGRRGPYPIQVFAGKGYAVLEPNYRGSTGYGERFRGLNRGDISGKDWIDIDSGVDMLVASGLADPERLGIMGWSFGGHHTYWGITQTDRFRAASAGAGANDLVSMYSQTDLPEFYHTYLGPKPWEDFELYEERSAYRNVSKVTTPLLIQVGEKDERVPAEQSIQFYEAVSAIGKAETELVIYPGQGHGIRDPRLLNDLMTRNVEWFSRWIP
jgi:dipeptidyl aminopeptidase/acylaminoacyl peptidase